MIAMKRRAIVLWIMLQRLAGLSLAWSHTHGIAKPENMRKCQTPSISNAIGNEKHFTRREAFFASVLLPGATMMVLSSSPEPALAYTPDPDPLRESLYLISRVQEAMVLQERFVNRSSTQDELKSKMKLTLRLVEKNYRLLDQITYASTFVEPQDEVVAATEAGYEAADALQGAIDFVKKDLATGPLTDSQRSFLTTSMQACRESLFIFLKFMPQEKLAAARKRVEEENVLNRDEFDGDADAGVYNPIVLPWKERS
jgi:hypothetical protein